MLNQKSNLKNQNHNSKVKNEFRERCYNYSITVIELIKDLPEKRVYWTLSDQLLRSATSIGANIVEAKSASLLTMKGKKQI
jgi:four helix bundle protein